MDFEVSATNLAGLMKALEADGVKAAFVKALRAAQQRARELGGPP